MALADNILLKGCTNSISIKSSKIYSIKSNVIPIYKYTPAILVVCVPNFSICHQIKNDLMKSATLII